MKSKANFTPIMNDKAGKKYYYDLENMQLDKDDIEELKTYLTPQSITFISNCKKIKIITSHLIITTHK